MKTRVSFTSKPSFDVEVDDLATYVNANYGGFFHLQDIGGSIEVLDEATSEPVAEVVEAAPKKGKKKVELTGE